jgi:hypothetical protein
VLQLHLTQQLQLQLMLMVVLLRHLLDQLELVDFGGGGGGPGHPGSTPAPGSAGTAPGASLSGYPNSAFGFGVAYGGGNPGPIADGRGALLIYENNGT